MVETRREWRELWVCRSKTRVYKISDFFFFQAEDGIRDRLVTGVQTCALPISTGPMGNGTHVGRLRPEEAKVNLDL